MRRQTAALLLVALVAWAAGATAILDPLGPGARPGPVDGETPADSLAAALAATGDRAYTVTIHAGNATDTERRYRVAVDGTDGQALIAAPDGDPLVYLTVADRWSKTTEGWWRHTIGEWSPTAVVADTTPIADNPDAVTVLARRPDTVVYAITDTDTAYEVATGVADITADRPNRTTTLRVTVDRDTGLPTRVVSTVTDRDGDGADTMVRIYRFTDWGDTAVTRPPGVPVTLAELLEDLTHVR